MGNRGAAVRELGHRDCAEDVEVDSEYKISYFSSPIRRALLKPTVGYAAGAQDGGEAGELVKNMWLTLIDLKSRIPSNIKPGNYLIRHELIALHQANTPQFYPECAQLVVSGAGDTIPPASYLMKIPGYAPQGDPGITVCTPALP
jgi:AA9 family protein